MAFFPKKFKHLWSNDIGIDLGTANTLVYVKGLGIVVNEPSVVAVNDKTGRVVAIGKQAKDMLGRTPMHIRAVKPVVDGVISDFEVTEEMIAYLVRRAEEKSKRFFGPRVVVGVPCGVTNVEVRAVKDAAENTGAREVHIIEEPMAAAVGIKLPIHEPIGSMIIDIGGGTTDIAVMSLGGIVRSKNLKIAGDRLNADIMSYIRGEFKILVGEKTAEELKLKIGSVLPLSEPLETTMKGRDLVTGLPREVIVTDADIREAIAPSIEVFLEAVKEVIETTPPEVVADVMQRGMYLVGGGALLRGIDQAIIEYTHVPVHIAEDPLTAVARGTGIILEDLNRHRDLLLTNDDERSL